ncbi:MAG: hypothetical protein IKS72_01560, partial [Prevotella sp.]|nr:hypothetical protein [Prevotella sp.]
MASGAHGAHALFCRFVSGNFAEFHTSLFFDYKFSNFYPHRPIITTLFLTKNDKIHSAFSFLFGQYFGTLIRGFFTDEPQAHSFEGSSAPFNAAFRREFQARCGYDPVDQLLKLFLQVPGAEAFRRDYYGTLTELFSSNFAKLNAWCAKRNLLFTGHCIYEEVRNNMQSFVLRNGDPHRMLSKFSAPGCDLLGHTVPYLKEQPGIHRKWAADHYN